MTIVKSFATGLGDTYYIRHNSGNFTIIDCHIPADRDDIIDEIEEESRGKGITRFISTHPDDDHIKGLVRLDDALGLLNFYVVENRATKPDYTVDFDRYCELRDSDRAFYLKRDCSRRWMNRKGDGRGSSGINILWPDLDNPDFKNVLTSAEDGGSPNNLSTIVEYSLNSGVTMLWLGDLETDFMETIEDEIELPKADVVLGEAPREYLKYYDGRDHLRQNTAWDITFENESGRTDVYVGNPDYEVPYLRDEGFGDTAHGYYMGSFDID